jgi:hypothetical protein
MKAGDNEADTIAAKPTFIGSSIMGTLLADLRVLQRHGFMQVAEGE